jgi:hypothetical protein
MENLQLLQKTKVKAEISPVFKDYAINTLLRRLYNFTVSKFKLAQFVSE